MNGLFLFTEVPSEVISCQSKPSGLINRIFSPSFSSDPLDLGIDDDQHDYDSVASDEDTDSELTTQNNNNTQRSNRAKVHIHTHTQLH